MKDTLHLHLIRWCHSCFVILLPTYTIIKGLHDELFRKDFRHGLTTTPTASSSSARFAKKRIPPSTLPFSSVFFRKNNTSTPPSLVGRYCNGWTGKTTENGKACVYCWTALSASAESTPCTIDNLISSSVSSVSALSTDDSHGKGCKWRTVLVVGAGRGVIVVVVVHVQSCWSFVDGTVLHGTVVDVCLGGGTKASTTDGTHHKRNTRQSGCGRAIVVACFIVIRPLTSDGPFITDPWRQPQKHPIQKNTLHAL